MEFNLPFIILAALSVATLIAALYVAFRIKSVLYLLHQPVVKKMSPQLRLKPVKLDEALNGNRNRDRQGAPSGRDGDRGPRPERSEGGRDRRDGDRGPRPEGDRRDGGRDRRDGDRNRDGRRDGNREGRPEGDRAPRADRPEGDRGPRPERAEGDRGPRRDGDRNRDGRRDGNRDGNRESRPPREFSENRESAPVAASSFNAETTAPAASESHTSLPARRPLPSFDAPAAERSESTAAFRDPAADTFVGAGEDVQHGRRTQLKKKPRFDIDETEATPTV
jgi:hypothetical protein